MDSGAAAGKEGVSLLQRILEHVEGWRRPSRRVFHPRSRGPAASAGPRPISSGWSRRLLGPSRRSTRVPAPRLIAGSPLPYSRAGLLRFVWLLATLVGPISASAQHDLRVGAGSHSLDTRSLRELRDLNVSTIRTTLYWNLWEGSTEYRQAQSEEIDRALREGFDLLIVVHGQPGRFAFSNHSEAFEAYAALMESLARRFPGVQAWQLWNEMDVPVFTDLFGARDGVRADRRGRLYGEMLALAYPAIKGANPSALVVTGGLAGPMDDGFLRGLLQSRAPFDALAIHAYGFPVQIAVERRAPVARALLDEHGRTGTPLWLTEFGMEEAVIAPGFERSSEAIDGFHLESWRDPIRWNAQTGIFERMYGHVLRQDGDRSFDLIRANGTLRPAATWLREYLSCSAHSSAIAC